MIGEQATLKVTVPFCPPQIPHDLTWARIRAAVVGSRRLAAQAGITSRVWFRTNVSPAMFGLFAAV
jgi:hypothetical protein